MNISILNFFFSLSSIKVIASVSMFLSYFVIYMLIIIAILLPLFIKRDFKYSFLSLMTGGISWIIVYFVKNIFIIPRPFVSLNLIPLFNETGFSFPSSHVAVAFAMSMIIWKMNHKAGIVFFVISFLIGISRMVIGVHYPLDVLVGAILGCIIGLFMFFIYNKTNRFAFLRKYI